MTIFLSVFSFQKVQAEGTKEPIRVGYIDYAGFIEQQEDGSYTGYGVEYLEKVSEFTKWDYVYVRDTWEKCLQMLSRGEIDLLCTAQYTDERARYMEYSDYSIGKESTIIYTKLGNEDIYYDDYSAMNGKTVALLKQSYQTDSFDEYAKKHGFQYKAQMYDLETEMMEAVKTGKADLVAAGSLDLHTDLKVVSKFNLKPFYFTTTKGNKKVLDAINTALDSINSTCPYFEEQLYQKYYGGSSATTMPLFTRSEAHYIKNSPPISVGLYTDASPITFYDEKVGGMIGISEDILQLIAKKSGLKFSYVQIEKNELSNWDGKEFDLLGAEVRNKQVMKNPNLKVSIPYFETSFSLAGYAENIQTYSQNTETRIAVNHLLTYNEECLKASYPNATFIFFDSDIECAYAVLDGKADLMLQNIYILSELLRKPQFEKLEMVPTLAMEEPIAMIGYADTDDILLSIIDKTIEVLDEKDVNQIIVNHTIANTNSLTGFDIIYKYRIVIITLFILFLFIIGAGIVMLSIRNQSYMLLKEKNRQLIEAIKQAEHANEAKSTFLSRMSHEIRTPMNAIIGINSLIRMHLKEPKKIESYVNKIALSSTLLLNLINDVLDMSAIDQRKLKIAMLPFDIQKVIESIISMYIPICRNKEIDFRVKYEEDIKKYVVGDQLRVNQILLNLLSNAVKFTPTKGAINLEVKKLSEDENREYLQFKISDTGIGIAEEQKDRLFEPFEQEDSETARNYGGSGLGLSITKNLVEMMKGAIHVESEKGNGACFIVELPFIIAAKAEEVSQIDEIEMREYDLSGVHILLADDNTLNCEIAVELLESANAVVDTVENGKEAVEKFLHSKPGTYQLILMDVQMPVMSGYEATAQIRHAKHEQARTIPILAMTANAFTEDVSASLSAGMNAHIAKPIDTSILFKTIEAYTKEQE